MPLKKRVTENKDKFKIFIFLKNFSLYKKHYKTAKLIANKYYSKKITKTKF